MYINLHLQENGHIWTLCLASYTQLLERCLISLESEAIYLCRLFNNQSNSAFTNSASRSPSKCVNNVLLTEDIHCETNNYYGETNNHWVALYEFHQVQTHFYDSWQIRLISGRVSFNIPGVTGFARSCMWFAMSLCRLCGCSIHTISH